MANEEDPVVSELIRLTKGKATLRELRNSLVLKQLISERFGKPELSPWQQSQVIEVIIFQLLARDCVIVIEAKSRAVTEADVKNILKQERIKLAAQIAAAGELLGLSDEDLFLKNFDRTDKQGEKFWSQNLYDLHQNVLKGKSAGTVGTRCKRASVWLDVTWEHVRRTQDVYLREFAVTINEYLSEPINIAKLRTLLAGVGISEQEYSGAPQQEQQLGGQLTNTYSSPSNELPLPPDRKYFAAREDELSQLDRVLREHPEPPSPVVITVTGMGGVGKTTLAAHWAHRALHQGMFPGGHVYIDLQGYSANTQISSAEAAHTMLKDLGIEIIPDDAHAREKAFRSLAADRSMLIFLDNAKNEAHVRPLLPRIGQCFVIITGRKPSFAGLIADDDVRLIPIEVQPLNHADSIKVLAKTIGPIADDDPHTNDVIAKCGGLPLALRIVAAVIGSNATTLRRLAQDLETQPALSALYIGDEDTDLRVIFTASYRYLSPENQRAFRLLALRPRRGVDVYALVLLADIDTGIAGQVMKSFEHVGLIEKHGDRFDIHDLLYEYATLLMKEEDSPQYRRAATGRLVHAYYGCVNYAFNERNNNNPMVDTPFLEEWRAQEVGLHGKEVIDRFPDVASWFEAERENLVDLVKRACNDISPIALAPKLAFSLFYFLEAGGHWTEWEAVNEIGYKAAEELDDTFARAGLKRNMGRVYFARVRDQDNALRDDSIPNESDNSAARKSCASAIEAFEESASLYRQCAPGSAQEATVQREFADVYLEQAKLDSAVPFERAVDAYLKAQTLFNDQENPIASLNVPLSEAYRHQGEFIKAEECLKVALNYAGRKRDNGAYVHPRVKSYAELQYAKLHLAQGDDSSLALYRFDKAIEDFRSDNNRLGEARALAQKSRLLAQDSRVSEARHALQASLGILIELKSDESQVVQTWLDQLPGID